MRFYFLSIIPKASRYRLIVILGLFLIGIAAAGLFVSYIISGILSQEAEQKVLWETRLYAEQLQRIVVRAASRLDTLVASHLADTINNKTLVRELDKLRSETAGILRAWLVYPNGRIITSSNTLPQEIAGRQVWMAFLRGERPTSFAGVLLGETKTIISKPFKTTEEGPALVTLASIFLRGNTIVCVGGVDLSIAQAVADETRSGINWIWSKAPVKVYTPDGHLVTSPLEEERRLVPGLRDDSQQPLVRYFLDHPEKNWGTLFYEENGKKWVGAFVRDRTLGMVVTTSRPAEHLLSLAWRVTTILTVTAVLSLTITLLFVTMSYATEFQLQELRYRNKKAELRALQAYTNPHFLFNALSCLSYLANPKDYPCIPKAVKAIAEVLRYTLRETEAFVSLREEMHCIRNYIAIQRLRFRERFQYEENIPEYLLSLSIPKLTIQPLVENCFVHGVEKTLDPVTISVTAKINGTLLEVCVTDNGPGFDPENLKEIRELLRRISRNEEIPFTEQHVGLLNIHRRLLLIYGGSAGIAITENESQTKVTVKFPLDNQKAMISPPTN